MSKNRPEFDRDEQAVSVLDPRVAFEVLDIERARLVFKHEITEREGGYYYARRAQPTVERLVYYLCQIQGAECGVATASGMAAADLVLHTIFGDCRKVGKDNALPLIAYSDSVYYEIDRLIQTRSTQLGFEAISVPTHDQSQFEHALNRMRLADLRLLWLESPANPFMSVTDISTVSQALRDAGSSAHILVDNSTLPVFQRSLLFGADLELISLTKYVNGMGDAMGGAVLCRDERLGEALRSELDSNGAVLSPQTAHHITTNLVTLHLRMLQHCNNAQIIANQLCQHSAVHHVYYPTVDGACRGVRKPLLKHQMSNKGGGIVSLRLHGGYAAGDALMHAIRSRRETQTRARPYTLYIIPTFGMPSTHVEHYTSFIRLREGLRREDTSEGNIVPGFCRIAVGLGAAEHIWQDLSDVLDQVSTVVN